MSLLQVSLLPLHHPFFSNSDLTSSKITIFSEFRKFNFESNKFCIWKNFNIFFLSQGKFFISFALALVFLITIIVYLFIFLLMFTCPGNQGEWNMLLPSFAFAFLNGV